jgi:hypothetical protein
VAEQSLREQQHSLMLPIQTTATINMVITRCYVVLIDSAPWFIVLILQCRNGLCDVWCVV